MILKLRSHLSKVCSELHGSLGSVIDDAQRCDKAFKLLERCVIIPLTHGKLKKGWSNLCSLRKEKIDNQIYANKLIKLLAVNSQKLSSYVKIFTWKRNHDSGVTKLASVLSG